VLWIRDILVQIRIRGSVPRVTDPDPGSNPGPGSDQDPFICLIKKDPDPDPNPYNNDGSRSWRPQTYESFESGFTILPETINLFWMRFQKMYTTLVKSLLITKDLRYLTGMVASSSFSTSPPVSAFGSSSGAGDSGTDSGTGDSRGSSTFTTILSS
jgi:hypothetical protein